MLLAILGIIGLGGGLLFIYVALHSKTASKGAAAEEEGGFSDNGKVIYLFGPMQPGSGASRRNENDGEVPRDPSGNGD
jgi:hypothetical protein